MVLWRKKLPYPGSKRTLLGIGIHTVALLTCLSLQLVKAAQAPTESLRGHVMDGDGASLPGAALTVTNLITGFERVAVADARGEFSLPVERNVRYRLFAAATGFAPETKIIEAGQGAGIEFRLAPSGLSERVAVISGSRQEELRESLNTKVDVVGRNRIRDTGYESVAEVLQEVPGVLTRRGTGSGNSGSGGEQIQGIDSRQVLGLFDGVRPQVSRRIALQLDRSKQGTERKLQR